MKKDKRILALVLAAAMMGTTALPVWAQTPETTDSSVVEVEGTLENIIAAREALAAQPATLAEDDNNIQAAQTIVERVANAVKNHTETAEKVNIKDLNLDKDLVLSTLADLNARVEGGEAISKLSCYYSRDTGLAVAIGLEYCTAQDVAAMQVKLDQLVDQATPCARRIWKRCSMCMNGWCRTLPMTGNTLVIMCRTTTTCAAPCWKGLPSVTVTPKRMPLPCASWVSLVCW